MTSPIQIDEKTAQSKKGGFARLTIFGCVGCGEGHSAIRFYPNPERKTATAHFYNCPKSHKLIAFAFDELNGIQSAQVVEEKA